MKAGPRGRVMDAAEMIARQGIERALAVHSRGVDRADATLLASAYQPGATVDYGFYAGGATGLVALLTAAQKTTTPTLHCTSNIWIRRAGDAAISESYVCAYVEEPTAQRLVFGRYLDRHQAIDGEWRLTHRNYVLDGNINRPTTAARADPPMDATAYAPVGAKGAADCGRALLTLHRAEIRSRGEPAVMSDRTDAARLDAALSRLAIHDLAMAYARGVDRADADLLKSIFHADATVVAGAFNGPAAHFAEHVTALCRDSFDSCFHSIANEWVEVSGDHAVGELYVIAHVHADGRDIMTGGRYIDRYERREDVWKIASRTFVTDWNSNNPTTRESEGLYAALTTRGCFGPADPVYALWASLA